MRFRDAFEAPGFGAIAEFKRRSPSAGELRPGGDVVSVASAYERAGARAMSVLVDGRFAAAGTTCGRHGRRRRCRCSRRGSSRPPSTCARRRRPARTRCCSSCATSTTTPAGLLAEASALGLDTLVEAHDAGELARATALGAPVIGVNARDLSTFAIDRGRQLGLLAARRATGSSIAESAIETRAQGAAAELAGARAMLVGSTLMRAADPGAKLAELIARPLVKVCGLTRREDVDAAVDAGADLVGFVLARESPRRADELLDAPETVLRVAVFVGEEAATDADLVQLYRREDGHRSRDGVLRRGGEQVGTVVDMPWDADDPTHSSAPARPRAASCSPAASALRMSQPRSARCGRGRSTPRVPPSASPA